VAGKEGFLLQNDRTLAVNKGSEAARFAKNTSPRRN